MEKYAAISLLLILIAYITFTSAALSNDVYDRIDHISTINTLLTRLESMEQQTATLTQRYHELEARNQKLEELVFKQTQILSELVEENAEQEERTQLMENAVMDVISDRLRASKSEINTLVSHEVQMSSFQQETLREFLGNRAAELLAYSPHLRFEDSITIEEDISSPETTETEWINESVGRTLNLLTESNRKMVKKIEHLEGKLSTGGDMTSAKHTGLDRQIIQQLVDSLSNSVDDIVTRGEIQAESRKSAFSAAATKQQVGTNGALTPLVLDHVFLNKGSDFNVTNSTFVCEVPGYYFFTYTMRTYDGYTLAVNLVKNGEFVTAIYSDQDMRNVMDSQSVMLELVPGDVVYLALGPSEKYAYYSDKNNLSTFSGFLLYKKS